MRGPWSAVFVFTAAGAGGVEAFSAMPPAKTVMVSRLPDTLSRGEVFQNVGAAGFLGLPIVAGVRVRADEVRLSLQIPHAPCLGSHP
jgi:hypothetical protein